MPPTSVYFVWPRRMAWTAASLMRWGVSKSGSPAPNEITSMPRARSSLALACTASVEDGANVLRRSASTGGYDRLEAIGQHWGVWGALGAPRHFSGYFSVSRFSTTGGTIPATDVPKLATSLINLDEMYVYFSCGMRNTVSTVDRSLRFMSAIWNSYSKSDTARMPRTMQSARSRATRS